MKPVKNKKKKTRIIGNHRAEFTRTSDPISSVCEQHTFYPPGILVDPVRRSTIDGDRYSRPATDRIPLEIARDDRTPCARRMQIQKRVNRRQYSPSDRKRSDESDRRFETTNRLRVRFPRKRHRCRFSGRYSRVRVKLTPPPLCSNSTPNLLIRL